MVLIAQFMTIHSFYKIKKLCIKGETTQLTIDNMAQAVIDVDPNKKPEYIHTFID